MSSSEDRPLRVGAIGCGRHATTSILPNLAVAGLALTAVCTTRRATAEAAADRFGVRDGAAFDEVRTMLDEVELDGVVVVVPPDRYAEVVGLAVERGVPVFAEKPGAASFAEAETLAAQADAAQVPVVVGFQKRFAPTYRIARDVIHDAEFGPVTLASFTWAMGPMGEGDRSAWLVENPVHHVDLARFLLGELHDVHVVTGTAGRGHALVVTASTDAGAPVSLQLTTTGSWHQRNEVVEVFGQGHSVTVDNLDTCTWRPPERPERVWRPNYTVPLPHNSSAAVMGFAGALAHFHDVLAGTAESPVSDIASAARTLRLVDAIARSGG